MRVGESSIHGLGVFAVRAFSKGDCLLAIDDSRLVTADAPLRESAGEFSHHSDYLMGGTVVLMQPPERHINHCCDPNTSVSTREGVRYVIARRDIAAGEEITMDYCVNSAGDTVWVCRCGSPRCRHNIHSDFFHLPLELQLAYLPLLDGWYGRSTRPRFVSRNSPRPKIARRNRRSRHDMWGIAARV